MKVNERLPPKSLTRHHHIHIDAIAFYKATSHRQVPLDKHSIVNCITYLLCALTDGNFETSRNDTVKPSS
jgi:hypothetical protein